MKYKITVDLLMCACKEKSSDSPMTSNALHPQRPLSLQTSSLQAWAHHFDQAITHLLPNPGPLPTHTTTSGPTLLALRIAKDPIIYRTVGRTHTHQLPPHFILLSHSLPILRGSASTHHKKPLQMTPTSA